MSEPQPQEGANQQPQQQAPPWGSDDEFNPQKAWDLIQNLRADKDKLAARPALTDEQRQQLSEYQQILESSKSDLERANEEMSRWQTEAQTWRQAAVGSRVEALAAQSFADPSDAVSALADKNFLDSGGRIDEAAIKKELDDLLQRKPHWARPTDSTQARRLPAPNGAQGSSGGQPPADPASQFASIIQGQLGSP